MVPVPAAPPLQVAASTPSASEEPATTEPAEPATAGVEPDALEGAPVESSEPVTALSDVTPLSVAAAEPVSLTPAPAPVPAEQQQPTPTLPLEASSEPASSEAQPEDPPLARLEVPVNGNGQMLNLKLSFKGKSWATVYASDGTRLLYELGRRGRPRTLSSRAPLTVIVGAIDAVEMRVNDKLITIPRQPGKDSIKFILDVAGVSGGDTRSAADVGAGG
jgi:cytoskeletal protein RodZ